MWPVISVVTLCPAPLVQPSMSTRCGVLSGSLALARSSASWSRLPGPCPVPATILTLPCQVRLRSLEGPLSARSIDGTASGTASATALTTGTGGAATAS